MRNRANKFLAFAWRKPGWLVRAGLACLLLVWHLPVAAQTDCRALLREVYQQAEQSSDPGDQLLYSSYRTVSYFRADRKAPLQTAKTELELYVTRDMIYYKGEQIICVRDAKQVVTIIPESRRILVAATPKASMNSDLNRQWRTVLADSLQTMTTPVSCQETNLEGKSVYKIVLSVLPNRQNRLGAKQMTFWVDSSRKTMRRLEILHPAGMSVEKTEMTFSEPRSLDDRSLMPRSASLLAWDRKGKLLPAYRGYEVVRMQK